MTAASLFLGRGGDDAVRLWDEVSAGNRTDLVNSTANVSFSAATIGVWVNLASGFFANDTANIFNNGINWAGSNGRITLYLYRNSNNSSVDRSITLLLNDGVNNYFALSTSNLVYPLDTWFWLGLCYSAPSGVARCYVNNTLVGTTTVGTQPAPPSLNGFQINSGSGAGGLSLYNYWLDNTYFDLDVEANRRKFITAGNSPVNLGNNGQLVTGVTPQLYFGGASSSWLNNKGALSSANLTATTPANFGKASTKPS